MPARVLILQNKLGVDGRSRVVAGFVRALNGRGIVPDIFLLAGSDKLPILQRAFGRKLEANVTSLLARDTIPSLTLLQQVSHNLLSRKTVRGYDIVINSNNSVRWLPEGPRYLHYIHEPPEAVIAYNRTFRNPLKWAAYRVPLALLERGPRRLAGSRVMANSAFTEQAVRAAYADAPPLIDIVYPPVTIPTVVASPLSEKHGIVSLGAFNTHKRQLDQIAIAAQLPTIAFTLIGSKVNGSYFQQCEDAIAEHHLQNVTLLPDATTEQIGTALSQARLFLHTKPSEQFGIATVEAIAHGAVPVIPDSGGQVEVVPIDALRFGTIDGAVALIRALYDSARLADFRRQLQAHCEQFSAESFQRRVGAVLDPLLKEFA